MTPDEINEQIDEIDRSILEIKNNLDNVEVERYKLKKQLFELTEAVRMAKFNLSKKKVEKEILQRDYWRARGR